MPAAKSDNLKSIPRTHSMGGKDQAIFNLWPAHACPTLTNIHTHTDTQINTNIYIDRHTNTDTHKAETHLVALPVKG